MQGNNLLKEAVAYFSDPAFARLMGLMAKRYQGLGRIGGTVKLNNPKPEVRQAIGGVLGRDLTGQTDITVSLTEFDQAIQQTRFAGISLLDILTARAGGQLFTNQEKHQQVVQRREELLYSLKEQFKRPNAQEFINQLLEPNGKVHPTIKRALKRDSFQDELRAVLGALENLPRDSNKEFQRLPVWATSITGDPHAFDTQTNQGKLLLAALENLYHLDSDTAPELSGNNLLEHFGIVPDDLLNFVTCLGLIGETKNGPHPVWTEAAKVGTVLNVPLRELSGITKIYPAVSQLKKVFVMENPGVFSAIADALADQTPPIVCIHGQPRTAVWMLLDRLVAADAEILYSGDFDPEGILIAQRICHRFPNHAKPWRYSQVDYQKSVSAITLSPKRLAQLKQVKIEDLKPLAAAVAVTKKAGYQEKILEKLVGDIRSCYGPEEQV
ncbi:MAG: TIGR02679 family protein [Firmicutes bacterium]|nr:TIGR02679 family protein [Bacillota bacterium]